jgi:pimeloyl-ACP methyl ester carboxylesterase
MSGSELPLGRVAAAIPRARAHHQVPTKKGACVQVAKLWLTAVVALSLPSVVVATGQAPGTPLSARPDSGLHACATATERCDGDLRVPVDWDDPGSGSLTVPFAWVPRGDTTRPAVGTILANLGGPRPALPSVPLFQELLRPVLVQQNLLVVELRGFGGPDALLCPDLDLGDVTTVVTCADALGPRVQYYTTDQIVRDMDAVREALGVSAVTFYGNSYGTVFAQAYAARFPERTAALYLDSVVPTDEGGYVVPPGGRGMDAIELVCGRSPQCAAIPGRPTAVVERLIDELRTRPDSSVPVGAIRPLLQGVNVVGTREVVAAAAAYLAGDVAPLHRLSRGLGSSGPVDRTGADQAASLAIMCGDARLPYDGQAPLDERRRQLNRYHEIE